MKNKINLIVSFAYLIATFCSIGSYLTSGIISNLGLSLIMFLLCIMYFMEFIKSRKNESENNFDVKDNNHFD